MSAALSTAAVVAGTLLIAAPASAATCSGLPPAGSSCIFAGPGNGSGAGQVSGPEGVAVDQSTGAVYVADEGSNRRVDEFDSAGHFLRAFGLGVSNGADELQTCTTLCIAGSGNFRPSSLAVDAAGDLYVAESFPNFRIQKFKLNPSTHEFEFLLMFGGGVDQGGGTPAHPGNLCTAEYLANGDTCGAGNKGTGPGELGQNQKFPIAFDSAGDLWLGDVDRLEQFSEAGAFLSEVALPGVGEIQSLAVDTDALSPSFEDFYVKSSAVAGVQKLKPNGELIETLDASGHPNALALDPATGDLFVSDQLNPNLQGTATLLSYDSSGVQTEAFGSGEVIGGPQGNALAFGDTAQSLYVVSSGSGENSAAQIFTPPAPGPLPVFGSSEATAIAKTAATLCAEVNPENASTTVHFEYVDQESFEKEGGFSGPHTKKTEPESAPIGSDFQPHEICQPVSPLIPATAYRFRVVATNANGTIDGETVEFATLPPAAIDSTGAADVTADSATLEAEINPLGDATSYHFEFLTEAAYLAADETFAGAAQAPLEPAPLGADATDLAVSQHIQGLSPGTVYRFRVVVRNKVSEEHTGGDFAGPTRAFTTQLAATAGLPDARAWEQVSPPDKHGASFAGINEKGVIQAAASGAAITYLATAPTEVAPQGNPAGQVLSARGPAGWSSLDLNPPHQAPTGAAVEKEFRFFSSDLSLALLQPLGSFDPSLSPQASAQTPYLRTDFSAGAPTAFCASSCYRPLVTGAEGVANVPAGTEFGGPNPCISSKPCGPKFLGATPDLSHLVLESEVALTATPLSAGVHGLYEWSAGAPPTEQLRLLSLLPNGEPVNAEPTLGFGNENARNAISPDGSRVVFAAGQHLYLRLNATEEPSPVSGSQVDGTQCTEPANACTVQLDALEGGPGGSQPPAAHFQLASADASRLFFTDSQQLTPGSGGASGGGGDLYEYDLAKPLGQRLADLTPATPAEAAGVQGLLPGASEDASYLYFVADGVLAHNQGADGSHAEPGDCSGQPNPSQVCNLYLSHSGATTFIATVSGADSPDWAGFLFPLPGLTARVSPDGRWLAFMSERPLTGYDNRDAVSGQPDQEVFLYHAAAIGGAPELLCASCNPTGARPHGVEIEALELAGGNLIWPRHTWLAANIPGWTPHGVARALYQSRYLSDSGRLFFDSSDALVPADTNGAEDVYQYEPPQGGEEGPSEDTCTRASPTFSLASQGCVDLISSGTSARESAFLDASETGDDVFFLTSAQLAGTDTDSSLDVYDARVNGGFPEAVKPVECSGDACQPPATPPNDPTPGSLTFQGAGNVKECPRGKVKQKGKCVAKHHKRKHPKKNKKKAHKRTGTTRGAGR